jgi:hypothetical protein
MRKTQRNTLDRKNAKTIARVRHSEFLRAEVYFNGAVDHLRFNSQVAAQENLIGALQSCSIDVKPKLEAELNRVQTSLATSGFGVGTFPQSPSALAFSRMSHSYDALVTGDISEQELNALIIFFKAELSRHPWGRILFFLVMGGRSNLQGLTVSRLPKILLPLECAIPDCAYEIDNTSKHKQWLCGDCGGTGRNGWSSTNGVKPILQKAFEIVYDFATKVQDDVQSRSEAVWEGYEELCRYNDSKRYHPVMLTFIGFQPFYPDATNGSNRHLLGSLAGICNLPHEIQYRSVNNGTVETLLPGFGRHTRLQSLNGVTTFSSQLSDYVPSPIAIGQVYLPALAFRKKPVMRTNALPEDEISTLLRPPVPDGVDNRSFCHPYKLVSCYRNAAGLPIDLSGQPDNDNYIFLQRLTKCLASDILTKDS